MRSIINIEKDCIPWDWTTDGSSPVHFEVNREARAVALWSYERAAIWEYCRSPWLRRTFIDYSKDILYFHEEDFLDLFDDLSQRDPSWATSPARLEKANFLAVSVNRGQSWLACFLGRDRRPGSIDDAVQYVAPILEVFTALKTLVFVMDEGGSGSLGDIYGELKEIMDADAEWDDECWLDEWYLGAQSPFSVMKRQHPHLRVPKVQFRRSIDGIRSEINASE
jgi:hypothetical protein